MTRIDCHSHISSKSQTENVVTAGRLVEAADRLDIDAVCCSIPISGGSPKPAEFRACNEELLDAMREYPDKIMGYCFVNPGYQHESLEEIEKRVVEDGMIGVKLYNQYKCSDPVIHPIVRKAIELQVPILQHAAYLTDQAEAAKQPNISNAQDIASLSAAFPEAMIIEGHLLGGGDWERALKVLRNAKTVFVDTSGSVTDSGSIEKAVRYVGAERLLFATDLSMEEGVGKILDANISEEEKRMIFGQNFLRILGRRGKK